MLRSHLTLLAVLTLVVGCKNSTPGPSGSMFDRNQASSAGAVPPSWNSENMVSNGGPLAAGQPPNGTVSVDQILSGAHEAAAVGQLEEARAGYEQVLQFQPENYVAHHRLAVIADNSQDFRTAEKHYRLALAYAPDQTQLHSELHSDLGYSYLLQGRYAESEQNLKRSLEFNPSYAKALNNLGALYGKQGDYDGALAMFRRSGAPEVDVQENLRSLFPNGPPPSSQSYAARANTAGFPGNPGGSAGSEGLQSQFPPAGSPDAWGRDLNQAASGVMPSSGEAFGQTASNAAQYQQDAFGQPAPNSFRAGLPGQGLPENGHFPDSPLETNGGGIMDQLPPAGNGSHSFGNGQGAFGVPGSGQTAAGHMTDQGLQPSATADSTNGQFGSHWGGPSQSLPHSGSQWPQQQAPSHHEIRAGEGPGFGAPGSSQHLQPPTGTAFPETSAQQWPQSQTTVPGQLQPSDPRNGYDHRMARGNEQSLPSWSPNLPESQNIQQTHFQQSQTATPAGAQQLSSADARAMLAGMSAGGLFPVGSSNSGFQGANQAGASPQRPPHAGSPAQPATVQGPGQVQRLSPGSNSVLGSQMPTPDRYWGTPPQTNPQQYSGQQPGQEFGTGFGPQPQNRGGVQFGPGASGGMRQEASSQWPVAGQSAQHGRSLPMGSPAGNQPATNAQLTNPTMPQQMPQQFVEGRQLPSWQDPAADAALQEFEDEVRRHNAALNPYSTNRGTPASIGPQSVQSSQHNQWMPENVTVPSTQPRF